MSPPRKPASTPSTGHGPAQAAGLVSNGVYRVRLDADGGGESHWSDRQLTGGRGPQRGLRLYIRDLDSTLWWSLGTGATSDGRSCDPARLDAGVGELHLRQHVDGIEAVAALWVDARRPCELRRVTFRNERPQTRRLEITTFVEVVLHDAAAHLAHPVFSKLFLQTELVTPNALLVQRRPRASDERFPWLVHALLEADVTEFETDRAEFLGRGRTPWSPRALSTSQPLSGRVGNVLDPVLALRTVIELAPRQERTLVLLLGVGAQREEALGHVALFTHEQERRRGRREAAADERTRRMSLRLDDREASHLQALAAAVMDGDPSLRSADALREAVRGSASDLASRGLSAAHPIVHLDAARYPRALAPVQRAQGYWRALGLPIQLVVEGADSPPEGEGIYPVAADASDAANLRAWAAWCVQADALPAVAEPAAPPLPGDPRVEPAPEDDTISGNERLLFANAHGGFSATGDEYVIHLRRTPDGSWSRPPLPWINVIANERAGVLWSEAGAGSTWSGNSREHRLTPWLNDPVLDPHAEALHVRDDETGTYGSAWPGPTPDGDHYEMRHGFGYSRCIHRARGLEQEATVFVPTDDPVRLLTLRLRNLQERSRRLSVFWYAQLVLGTTPETSGRTVVTSAEPERSLVLATNPLTGEFADAMTFATATTDADPVRHRVSADARAYLGAAMDLASPRTVARRLDLEPRFGAQLAPCFAQQLSFILPPGGETRICLLLGEAKDRPELDRLLERFGTLAAARGALERVVEMWRERRGAVETRTPSAAFDLMVNGWLIYQTVACRLWARSAFYQAGGAYGFRDQLQDAVALVAVWPSLAREQILRHAAHQFEEGDVLHWWHPPHSRGLRTRFADDLLWLPHLTAHYVRVTGDTEILEETAPFLRARSLADGEDEAFLTPEPSGTSGTVFEHCLRALDRSLAVGRHGLPPFGSGDWNDGMNRVGREGRGESVWMGFFLYTILGEWDTFCTERNDTGRAARYREHRRRLREALDDGGWDGEWYRRGYYDDGAPLGSRTSDECQIDALAQAWSVLSRAAPPERAAQAMDAVLQRLVSETDGIIRLLTPPFRDTPHDPGYIKGYVAGVRENGGQYTHAALWVVRALAEMGRRDTAMRLLDMLNPVRHALDDEHVQRYRVEPYVVAADVYGEPPHVGRGGWTWYTGSSGWMLRVALESILGVHVEDGRWLVVDPHIPDEWPGFHLRLRPLGGETTYEIEVQNPDHDAQTVVSTQLDGEEIFPAQARAKVALSHDGGVHHLVVVLGRIQAQSPPLQREGATP